MLELLSFLSDCNYMTLEKLVILPDSDYSLASKGLISTMTGQC